jgi:phosphatidate cytidylyltransferase
LPDFLRRAGTAAVLLAALVAALFLLPRAGIVVLMAVIVAAAALEWARLCAVTVPLYAGAAVAAFLLVYWLDGSRPVFFLATAFWLLAAPAWLRQRVRPEQRAALAAAGFVVLVPAALAMVALEPGEALLVLAVAWIADTAAYFAGTRWGRHKLAPAISPGKTWEGAAGGLIGGAAYAMILSLILAGAQATRMAAFVGAAALLVTVSIVGDLFESAAKRQAGVKDSGALLPGHGGVLDRIDSASAILPVAALVAPFLKSAS